MSDLLSLLKADLVKLCEEAGLSTEGTKAELIARLEAEAPAEAPAEAEVEEAPAEEPAPAPVKKSSGGAPDPEDESLSAEEFIRAAYLHVLGREVDRSGLRHYLYALNLHKTRTRAQVIEDLEASEEARARRG